MEYNPGCFSVCSVVSKNVENNINSEQACLPAALFSY